MYLCLLSFLIRLATDPLDQLSSLLAKPTNVMQVIVYLANL